MPESSGLLFQEVLLEFTDLDSAVTYVCDRLLDIEERNQIADDLNLPHRIFLIEFANVDESPAV